jgi:hypothetical protein
MLTQLFRQLGKRSIATEEEINKMAYDAEKKAAKMGAIRRAVK